MYGDNLPVLNYIDEIQGFLLDGGYLAFTFICQPLTGGNQQIMNALDDLYEKDYPKDSLQQINLFASPYIQDNLEQYATIREGRTDGELSHLYDEFSRDNYNFLKNGTTKSIHPKSGLKIRDFEVWLSFKLPLKKQSPSKEELKTFCNVFSKMKATLETIGTSPVVMNAELYIHRMQILHNHGKKACWRDGVTGHDAAVPLRYQVLERDGRVLVDKSGLEIGDIESGEGAYVKTLSVQKYPEVLQFGDIYDIVCDWRKGQNGIRNPFLMTLNIHYPDQEKSKDTFMKDRSWITHQASGPTAKWVDRLRYQKRDYDEFFNSTFTKGAKIANFYLQLTVFGDDKQSCEKIVSEVQSFAALKNFKFIEDKFICLPLFLSALPMGVDKSAITNFNRFNRVTTDLLKFFTPMIASWKGNAPFDPVLPLITRDGQLFSFNPFISSGNYNCAISASSGAGKSYLINAYISNFISTGETRGGQLFRPKDQPLAKSQRPLDGGRVFAIDVGYSYLKLCELYKGRYIDFGKDLKYSLNPFRTIHEFSGTEGQGVMVLALLKFMASPRDQICDFQSSRMFIHLKTIWDEKGQEAKIDDFADLCKADEDQRVRDVGYQLEPWCQHGPYGEYFNDDFPPLDFSGNFVVIELEELKDKKDLQTAVLLQCISCIQHEMYLSGIDKRKALIFDEAWSFLKDKEDGGESEAVAQFLETGWRRFRKYNSQGLLVTQGLDDYYGSRVGRAIISNSSFKVFLRQDPESITKVQKEGKFDGTQADIELMKSVETVKGEYSEMFIQCGPSREVCRLFVPRFQQLMFTTDASEKRLITNKMESCNIDIADAIAAIVREEALTTKVKENGLTEEQLEDLTT